MLKVENVTCGYNNISILKSVSFSVKQGEKVCVLGPNGCGKTTLIRAISSVLPYQGNVFVGEKNLRQLSQKELAQKMAVMSQTAQTYFAYTVYETVLMGRYAHKKGGMFAGGYSVLDKEIAQHCICEMGLEQIKNNSITQLSGGQLQRVFLARTFAQDPDILVLDEPTNHLDLKYQIELSGSISQWTKRKKRCVLGVLHDINLAMSFADRILLMKDGRIVSDTPTGKLDLEKIGQVYETDVQQYMHKTLKRWEK